MTGLEGIALYTPAFEQGGAPVAGPDEDEFTLVAAAVEQLGPAASPLPGAAVHLVGTFPPVVEWGLAAFLGHEVRVVPHPAGLPGLAEALDEVTRSPEVDSPALVLAAEIPERGAGSASAGRIGAGGIALRFGPGRPLTDRERGLLLGGPAVGVGASALVAHRTPEKRPPARAGRPLAVDTVRPFVGASLAAVSEGAYVPRARYLENLPSRWRLIADRCGSCGSLTFPQRGGCRACGARDGLTPTSLPRDGGRVLAATSIGQGGQPTEFDLQVGALGDYGVVLVELAPGVRVTLQVTDARPGEVAIGARVRTQLRRLYPMEGEWRYGRKALPGSPGA
jgi:uncharacterized OB-fold protein